MSEFYRVLSILSFFLLASPQPTAAEQGTRPQLRDFPAFAEIFLEDERIRLTVDVFIPEEAGAAYEQEELKAFFSGFIRFETNRVLLPRILKIEPRLSKRRFYPAPLANPSGKSSPDQPVLQAEMVFALAEKPKELSVIAGVDAGRKSKVPIGMTLTQYGLPVIPFTYLAAGKTLILDWTDPRHSRTVSPTVRHDPEAPFSSFLYVEQHEVRHEILARVSALEGWMDADRRRSEFIEADQWDDFKARAGKFLLPRNEVRIDGEIVRPIIDWIDFIQVSPSGISVLEKPRRLDKSRAVLGVVLAYATDGRPQEAVVEWELFNGSIPAVQAAVEDPSGLFHAVLRPEDNRLVWRDYFNIMAPPRLEEVLSAHAGGCWHRLAAALIALAALIPLGTRLLLPDHKGRAARRGWALGGGFLLLGLTLGAASRFSVSSYASAEKAREILEPLLKNVYRSFDFREEGAMYDQLALSVSGDLLTTVYLQHRRSFSGDYAGGANTKVRSVTVHEVEVKEGLKKEEDVLSLRAKWTAVGDVGHWGHHHKRKNCYEALVDIQPTDGKWKISGLKLLEEIRVDPETHHIVALEEGPAEPGSK